MGRKKGGWVFLTRKTTVCYTCQKNLTGAQVELLKCYSRMIMLQTELGPLKNFILKSYHLMSLYLE